MYVNQGPNLIHEVVNFYYIKEEGKPTKLWLQLLCKLGLNWYLVGYLGVICMCYISINFIMAEKCSQPTNVIIGLNQQRRDRYCCQKKWCKYFHMWWHTFLCKQIYTTFFREQRVKRSSSPAFSSPTNLECLWNIANILPSTWRLGTITTCTEWWIVKKV